MLNKQSAPKLGVPPALRDRYIVRCVGQKFGPSSKGNPMVTLDWEIAGIPLSDGTVGTQIKRGDETFVVSGIRCNTTYFPLVSGPSLARFFEFLDAAGMPVDEVDETNFDVSPFDGICMNAIVTGTVDVERKVLTDEDRAAGKAIGDPILDEDGKTIAVNRVIISKFLSRYTGDLPTPY